jgi:GWxTD domain-containing protein
LFSLAFQDSSQAEEKKVEPLSKWSKQWLEEVVPYIITGEEKTYFLNLPTETERGQFMLRFWKVRDPDPSTPDNEFKLEHYRRIAVANKFLGTSGIAGWRTIRGRVYILLGPPQGMQTDTTPVPSGVWEQNLFGRFELRHVYRHHGGAEVWEYYGISKKTPYWVQFIFLDKDGSGNYELAGTVKAGQPWEKGSIRSKADVFANPTLSSMHDYFDQLETQTVVLKNPFEKEDVLKGIVKTQVSYDYIPLKFEAFHLTGTEEKTHSTLSAEIPYSALSSKLEDGKHYFSLSAIIDTRDRDDQVVSSGSREFNFELTDTEYSHSKDQIYTLYIPITLKSDSYKIELIVLDNYSGKVGTLEEEIFLPSFAGDRLMLSYIFLSSPNEEKGVHEDVLQLMNMSEMKKAFHVGEEMRVLFEVYNLTIDPATGLPDFKAEYLFYQNEKLLAKVLASNEMIQDRKDCLIDTTFKLKKFKPGVYTLSVRVVDSLSGKKVSKEIRFSVN